MPKKVGGVAIRNNDQPLGYLPVMTDATKATTFDDIGTELNVFDTASNTFVYRYVDFERNKSLVVTPGKIVDLGDFDAGQQIIRGSGAEQMTVRGDLLFVSQLHSDKIEVFRINQNPADPSQILTELGIQFTGGITPQGSPSHPTARRCLSPTCRPRTSRSSASTRTAAWCARACCRSASPTDAGPGERRTRRSPFRRTRRSACAGSSRSRTPTMARSRAAIATGRAATTATSGTSAATRSAGRRWCRRTRTSPTTGRSGTRGCQRHELRTRRAATANWSSPSASPRCSRRRRSPSGCRRATRSSSRRRRRIRARSGDPT